MLTDLRAVALKLSTGLALPRDQTQSVL